jgi:hypothetical protein
MDIFTLYKTVLKKVLRWLRNDGHDLKWGHLQFQEHCRSLELLPLMLNSISYYETHGDTLDNASRRMFRTSSSSLGIAPKTI